MPILTSNDASVIRRKLEFEDQTVTIGRHPDCDIIIDDASVSRQHARIDSDNGVYYIEDLNSRNGTFLNNESIHRSTRKPVRPRDVSTISNPIYAWFELDCHWHPF